MGWPKSLSEEKITSLQNIAIVLDLLGGYLESFREGSRVEIRTDKDSYAIGVVTRISDESP